MGWVGAVEDGGGGPGGASGGGGGAGGAADIVGGGGGVRGTYCIDPIIGKSQGKFQDLLMCSKLKNNEKAIHAEHKFLQVSEIKEKFFK